MGDADVARGRAFHPPISDLLPNCERSVNEYFSRWRCCQEPGTLRKPRSRRIGIAPKFRHHGGVGLVHEEPS